MMFTLKGHGQWKPNDPQMRLWYAHYQRVDVDTEMLKMQAWLDANPTKRKTARGMPRFIVGWLNREARPNVPNVYARRNPEPMPTRGMWRDECEALGHDPQCRIPAHHELRKAIAAHGCQHQGVCETFGQCRTEQG